MILSHLRNDAYHASDSGLGNVAESEALTDSKAEVVAVEGCVGLRMPVPVLQGLGFGRDANPGRRSRLRFTPARQVALPWAVMCRPFGAVGMRLALGKL